MRRAASLRWAMAIVAAVAFAAAAAGIGSRASYGAQTTADEPHYLLTALSLARDGDLDVRDEFAEQAYRPFHEIELAPQARPLRDGRLIEPHDPLLPAVLAAPAALGGWVAAKLTLAAIAAALAALTLWTAVRRFGVPVLPAAAVVGVFAASAPLAAYGSQVYPELPAALAVAVALAALAGPLRRGGLAALGLAVVALPWLSVKYAPVAAVLAVLGLWMLARTGRRRAALALGGGLAAAALVVLLAHQALYGGLTPYAAGSHFVDGELTVVGSDPDYAGRGRRLVGLLVNRDFGIAAWQPAWLLIVPALACLLARRPRGWAALALPLATGWLVATFVALTMQGWWFPGRQVVVVLPAAVLAIAWWARGGGRRLAATRALGAAGVLAYGWIAVEGALGAHRLGRRPPGDGQPALRRLVGGHAGLPRRDRRHLGPALGLGGGAGGGRGRRGALRADSRPQTTDRGTRACRLNVACSSRGQRASSARPSARPSLPMGGASQGSTASWALTRALTRRRTWRPSRTSPASTSSRPIWGRRTWPGRWPAARASSTSPAGAACARASGAASAHACGTTSKRLTGSSKPRSRRTCRGWCGRRRRRCTALPGRRPPTRTGRPPSRSPPTAQSSEPARISPPAQGAEA